MIAPAIDYERVQVEKPWGFEYLMYGNQQAALWFLYIRPGEQTSLHCHPRKKTGLVLLSGEAEISFLNDSTRLKALNRVMIRPGLFHSTKAVSPDGIILLEIETPRDKGNLVRLNDAYGRKLQPYEGSECLKPLGKDRLLFDPPGDGDRHEYSLAGCSLDLQRTSGKPNIDAEGAPLILILEGGLFSDEGEPILSVGDVVTPATWNRLAASFNAPFGVTLLTIRKP